jgi:hypothetical protein
LARRRRTMCKPPSRTEERRRFKGKFGGILMEYLYHYYVQQSNFAVNDDRSRQARALVPFSSFCALLFMAPSHTSTPAPESAEPQPSPQPFLSPQIASYFIGARYKIASPLPQVLTATSGRIRWCREPHSCQPFRTSQDHTVSRDMDTRCRRELMFPGAKTSSTSNLRSAVQGRMAKSGSDVEGGGHERVRLLSPQSSTVLTLRV